LLKLQIPTENRMNVHKNARLTPRGRERIVLQVESGQTPEAVAQAVGVCPRTVRKWVDRYRREGLELTRRTCGRSLAQIVNELSVYLVGWRGYFRFCQIPSALRALDEWTRRRLRAIAWKQ
jgi:Group II intron, maturase-specific domain/leucine-zipper of insertion element IS481